MSFRQFVCSVAVVAAAHVSTPSAAERVTLVMTDGQRMSGTIGSQGDRGERGFDRTVSLTSDDGSVERVSLADVAIIDFGGGTPSDRELRNMTASGGPNVLMFRDGTSQPGTFIDIFRGNTVRWRSESNQTENIAVGEVSRIYVNPTAARTALNSSSGRWNERSGRLRDRSGRWNDSTDRSVGTSGRLDSATVDVDAHQQWTNTGIVVRRGDRLAFRATGHVKFAQGETQSAGPDGNASMKSPNYPVSGMPVGVLIGRVGSSAPFAIGSNTQPIAMPADGRLMLGVNDDEIADNSGVFSVAVTRTDR